MSATRFLFWFFLWTSKLRFFERLDVNARKLDRRPEVGTASRGFGANTIRVFSKKGRDTIKCSPISVPT